MQVTYVIMKQLNAEKVEYCNFSATPQELSNLMKQEEGNYTFELMTSNISDMTETAYFGIMMRPIQHN